jgi:hypothetical protein
VRGDRLVRVVLTVLVGVPALAVVVVVLRRHGHPETFVSWPLVGVTVLAAGVAVLGVWTKPPERWFVTLAALLPAAVMAYIVPAAFPLVVVALLLGALGGLALYAGDVLSPLASMTALLVLGLTAFQPPAVQCRTGGSTTTSGPWWIETDSGGNVGFGSFGPSGGGGTFQVGHRSYTYTCRGDDLVEFGPAG